MELTLLRFTLNPWICCVVLGDVLGCLLLFVLGLRKLAIGIYVVSSFIEAIVLVSHRIPVRELVWLTNLAPAIVLGIVLMTAGLRTMIAED
jgi:hypothetical protein